MRASFKWGTERRKKKKTGQTKEILPYTLRMAAVYYIDCQSADWQSQWKTVWTFLNKLQVELLRHPVITSGWRISLLWRCLHSHVHGSITQTRRESSQSAHQTDSWIKETCHTPRRLFSHMKMMLWMVIFWADDEDKLIKTGRCRK